MNKNISRFISSVAVAAMVIPMAACGSSSEAPAASSSAANGATAAASQAAGSEGSVLNIQAWNEEFKSRMEDHYPGYQKVDDTTGKIGDVTVKWTITPSDDNAYQNNLDAVLPGNADASPDDKVDIFLMEADYALKYVNSDVTMNLADLGITDADLSDQFDYTKDIVKDENGNIKGSSWQACSAGLIYNRQAAKDILGTDDLEAVQEAVKDWDTFMATAEKAKAAGYKMTSTVNDTYRVYSNNVSAPWVQDGKVVVDPNLKAWVDNSKEMVDAGETTTAELWSDDWSKGFFPDGKVFCYFGPAWLINFSMHADEDGSIANQGGWGMVVGPQSFYWGGTWIAAATGTDNPTLVKDIILTMTTDKDVLYGIAKKDSDCVNSKSVLNDLATNPKFENKILGGQNPYAQLEAGAEKVDMSNISPYDQGCNEEFQSAMKNYFDGNASYDDALAQFNTAIVEKYPDLTTE
ncbi:MAG: hypothetical protein PUE98_00720 [Galactobacillus timonensis]|uniref:hypothetical protein n=1 Tax=Galactobacillus timonensis TaxID=2041840 RepID=UPI00240A0887|nr:hypothetical protein [Galactobacillus timonensis]MDD6598975.1 hypothetical protein [Galactobacillus timonensis]